MVSAVTIVAMVSSTTFAQERPLIATSPSPATHMANPHMLGAGIALVTVGSLATVGGVVLIMMASNRTPTCSGGDQCAVTTPESYVPFVAASLGIGLTALLGGAIMIAEGSKQVPITESSIPMRWTF